MNANNLIILDNVIEQQHVARAPSSTESEFFEIFVAEQVLKDFDLSYEELESGLVGQGGDGGIDAIFVFANGDLVHEDFDFEPLKKNIVLEIYIVQAKRSPSFSESPIEKLIAVTEDLFDLTKNLSSFASVYNEGVSLSYSRA